MGTFIACNAETDDSVSFIEVNGSIRKKNQSLRNIKKDIELSGKECMYHTKVKKENFCKQNEMEIDERMTKVSLILKGKEKSGQTCEDSFQLEVKPLTMEPTISPTHNPMSSPSSTPSSTQSTLPTSYPSLRSSVVPSNTPVLSPTSVPSTFPSIEHSLLPSSLPSSKPSSIPTLILTTFPSINPTLSHSRLPSNFPSSNPSFDPSRSPSHNASFFPSSSHSLIPSIQPSLLLSLHPSLSFSFSPSSVQSSYPTISYSSQPSLIPTDVPTIIPTSIPSFASSIIPTPHASHFPSDNLTEYPSLVPSGKLSALPTFRAPSFTNNKSSQIESVVSTLQIQLYPVYSLMDKHSQTTLTSSLETWLTDSFFEMENKIYDIDASLISQTIIDTSLITRKMSNTSKKSRFDKERIVLRNAQQRVSKTLLVDISIDCSIDTKDKTKEEIHTIFLSEDKLDQSMIAGNNIIESGKKNVNVYLTSAVVLAISCLVLVVAIYIFNSRKRYGEDLDTSNCSELRSHEANQFDDIPTSNEMSPRLISIKSDNQDDDDTSYRSYDSGPCRTLASIISKNAGLCDITVGDCSNS